MIGTTMRSPFLLLLCLSYSGFCQHEVSGHVFEKKTNDPLERVVISIVRTVRGTITDENGFFKLQIPWDSVILDVSMIGYASKRFIIRKDSIMNIFLEEEEVVVGGKFPMMSQETKPIRTIKGKYGKVSIYSEYQVGVNNVLQGKVVSWTQAGYQIIVPYDSLMSFLMYLHYEPDTIKHIRKYLVENSTLKRISLTEDIMSLLGDSPFNNFALNMIGKNCIQILDPNNNPVKFLTRQHIEMHGNKRAPGMCWGGIIYFVPTENRTNEKTLFSIMYFIC